MEGVHASMPVQPPGRTRTQRTTLPALDSHWPSLLVMDFDGFICLDNFAT